MTAIFVAIAVYLAAVHIGMIMAVHFGASPGIGGNGPAVMRRRYAAAAGYVSGLIGAGLVAYFDSDNWRKPDFWATILVMVFGVSYAVYMVVPKLEVQVSGDTADMCEVRSQPRMRTCTLCVHGCALVLALASGAAVYWGFDGDDK